MSGNGKQPVREEGRDKPFFLVAIQLFVTLLALRLLGARSMDVFEQSGDGY